MTKGCLSHYRKLDYATSCADISGDRCATTDHIPSIISPTMQSGMSKLHRSLKYACVSGDTYSTTWISDCFVGLYEKVLGLMISGPSVTGTEK